MELTGKFYLPHNKNILLLKEILLSQHVITTCNESNGVWLPIIEYSVKTGVSLSTIRRKIKSGTIQYRLDKGRYLILLENMNPPNPPALSIPNDIHRWQDKPLSQLNRESTAASFRDPKQEQQEEKRIEASVTKEDAQSISQISDAFEHALTEKEARIRLLEKANRQLEERVTELKLLIRVLEDKYNVRY